MIRKYRDLKDVKQEELAFKIGISQGYLSQLELGERNIDAELLRKIADVLNIPINNFYTDEEPTVYNTAEPAPAYGSLDMKLIKQIIVEVEKEIKRVGSRISPEKKAMTVDMIYEHIVNLEKKEQIEKAVKGQVKKVIQLIS